MGTATAGAAIADVMMVPDGAPVPTGQCGRPGRDRLGDEITSFRGAKCSLSHVEFL